jgi:hypothetical protein
VDVNREGYLQFDSDLQFKLTLCGGRIYRKPRGQDEKIRLSGFTGNIFKEQALHLLHVLAFVEIHYQEIKNTQSKTIARQLLRLILSLQDSTHMQYNSLYN